MKKSISEIQREVHQLAIDKGWYEGTPRTELELIALIHGELSEAVEEIRKGHPKSYINVTGVIHLPIDLNEQRDDVDDAIKKGTKPEGRLFELADAVIRIMDYCEYHKMNLEKAIELKHEFNKTRPHRHGGKKY